MHSDARTASATDWGQILALYDQLMAIAPTPVAALNRAVAVAETQGPEAALALVEALDLGGYHVYHAVRAALLRRAGRTVEAAEAYDQAAARTSNAAEQAYPRHARDALRAGTPPDGGGQVAVAHREARRPAASGDRLPPVPDGQR